MNRAEADGPHLIQSLFCSHKFEIITYAQSSDVLAPKYRKNCGDNISFIALIVCKDLTQSVVVLSSLHCLTNQSIDRISIAQIFPVEPRLSGTTAESVFNRKIDETVLWHQQAVGCASV